MGGGRSSGRGDFEEARDKIRSKGKTTREKASKCENGTTNFFFLPCIVRFFIHFNFRSTHFKHVAENLRLFLLSEAFFYVCSKP